MQNSGDLEKMTQALLAISTQIHILRDTIPPEPTLYRGLAKISVDLSDFGIALMEQYKHARHN